MLKSSKINMSRAHVLRSNLNSIFANLAAEEALLIRLVSKPVLFLWRNNPTITVGRHQNPWKECNLNLMDEAGVTLARRYSGGGAVYQDLGCTTFTFLHEMTPSSSVTELVDGNFDMLVEALRVLGIPAARKGRNDVVVGESKVSGSAFKQTSSRLVHHGTILVNTDMSNLGRFLTPSKLKLTSKGISSVSARVSNLTDTVASMDHETVCDSLIKEFRKKYGCESGDPAEIVDEFIQSDPVFIRHHDQLRDRQWRFGSTPQFSHTVETRIDGIGMFTCHYEVEREIITCVKIFSDILNAQLIDRFESALKGCVYERSAVLERLFDETAESDDQQSIRVIKKFTEWILNEMF